MFKECSSKTEEVSATFEEYPATFEGVSSEFEESSSEAAEVSSETLNFARATNKWSRNMRSHLHPFPSSFVARYDYYTVVCPYLLTPANASRLGMSTSALAEITADFADYESVYIPSISPETRTTVLVQKKAAADKKLQKTLRTAFNDIPKSKLTVDDRHTLNLTERAKRGSAAQPMDSVPSVTIDARYRLVHRVWARDMHHVSGWGKPKGVHSCQIWVKVGGEAPTSEKEFAFAGSMTKPPFVVNHDEMDAGKTAYYRARWENNRGEVGTWSTTIAATVWG